MSVEDVVRGMKALDEAAPADEEAERYYEGRAHEVFAASKIARLLGQYGASFRANFAKIPVNAIANKLKITSITVPGNDRATKRIGEIRDLLGLASEEKEIHRKAGEYGDAFVLVLQVDPPEIEDGEEPAAPDDPDDPTVKAGWDLYFNSPLCARVMYDPDRPQRKLYKIKRWLLADKRWRVRLYYADTIEVWVTKGKTKGDKPSQWIEDREADPETGDQLDWPIVTDYGQLPAFHFRNGTPYGTPDHLEAYGPQNGITKVLASQTATVDRAAYNDRYGLLDPNAALNENNDDPDADDDSEVGSTSSAAGGQQSNLRGGPGSLTIFPGMKAVGEWSKAEPGALTSTLEQWIGIMAQVTGTPMKEFKVGGVQPAAEGDRQRQLEFNDKVRDRQVMYGAEWAKIWRFILRTEGLIGEDEQVKVAWDAPEDLDDADSWGVTQLKLQSRVPARQALSERGYSTDQLDKWGITDDTSPNVVDELVKVAGMAQQLGAAVSLGVLDAESAARYVNAALAAAVQGVRIQVGEIPQPTPPPVPTSNGRPPQLEPVGVDQ